MEFPYIFWGVFAWMMYGNTKKDPSADGKGDEWWHQWPDPAMTMIQYQKEGQSSLDAPIVWPDVYKTGDAIYVK